MTVGIVQLKITVSALRTARRSDGGFGNASDGGSGGPIVAQDASRRHKQETKIMQARPRMRIHRLSDRIIHWWERAEGSVAGARPPAVQMRDRQLRNRQSGGTVLP